MTRASAIPSMATTAMKAPYLERDAEHELAVRWQDHRDQNAMHQLVQSHMRLVMAMAARFRSFGLPMNDLIQEGHVGLLEAAARFQADRNVRFSTYATWWIRAAMQDYVLRNWSIVRGGTSSAQKALFFNLRRLRAKLAAGDNALGREDIHRQIAAAIGVSQSDVATMAARLSGNDASLNAPVGPDGDSDLADFLAADDPLPDEATEMAIDGERRSLWLQQALKTLSSRELGILKARRLSEEGATLEAIGADLGISKERVRQIENVALTKLKNALVSAHPELRG